MAFHGPKRRVRTIFLSDMHLGSPHHQAAPLLSFLEHHTADQLFLIGDVIDGWELTRKLVWRSVDTAIIDRLSEMSDQGTSIFYSPGNHDAFLRDPHAPTATLLLKTARSLGVNQICDRFVFESADGRRFLVIHGDQFDAVEQSAQWLSKATGVLYHMALATNRIVNNLSGRTLTHGAYDLCARLKGAVKRAIRFLSHFEQSILEFARQHDCLGVICGHIHTPAIRSNADMVYCNTGDWVENCTAIIERFDGTLELVYHFEKARPTEPVLSPASSNGADHFPHGKKAHQPDHDSAPPVSI